MTLSSFFSETPKVAVAFSGGVDSAYLLYAALQYAEDVRAYYVRSAFQPEFEYEDAKRLCALLHTELTVIPLDVLSDEAITDNPKNRCYYCKQKIFGAICKRAKEDGYSVVLDGTNASDDPDDRPGMRALIELSVLSPLRECGLSKSDIRSLSKEAGLFTHDKPAYACLATRIQTGEKITAEKLQKTERAENYLRSLGFVDFRVRMSAETAKIEVTQPQFALVLQKQEEILQGLRPLYSQVLVNLEGRK